MSNEENKIYIFVKGNKGKYAYIITNKNFDKIHSVLQKEVKDKDGNALYPIQSDREAMIKSLKYIIENESNNIPDNPIVHLITNLETNYEVAVGVEKPREATCNFKK